MDEMPGPHPDVPCQCLGSGYVDEETGCICGTTERLLRAGIALTAEQREWCVREIASVEGHTREECEGLTDKQLGRATINAWVDYCRDKGLL